MPRPRREDYEGAWQHVMNRGVARAPIFRSEADRQIFLESLVAAAHRYSLQIHAYCLLGNNYHLMLFSEKGQLSDGMRFLSARFTQRINYRDKRDGPLFRGCFASVPIKDDAHLVCVSRYIRRNPVEAGLVQEPQDWIWSSAGAYLGTTNAPAWLRTDTILEMFGTMARQPYRDFVAAEVDEPTRASYEHWKVEPP